MKKEVKLKIAAKKIGTQAIWRNRAVVRGDGMVFKSIKEAASAISATYGGIIKVCNGSRKKIYGHTFKYIEGESS